MSPSSDGLPGVTASDYPPCIQITPGGNLKLVQTYLLYFQINPQFYRLYFQ